MEIAGDDYEDGFVVRFIDTDSQNDVVYECSIKTNSWARTTRQVFTNWRIEVLRSKNREVVFEHRFDCGGQNVFISIESHALGDTLAWLPAVEEFRKRYKCNVTCSTFFNQLFAEEYPEIAFLEPGISVNHLYAMYRLGMFYTDKGEIDFAMHASNFRLQPMAKLAFDILNLEYRDIRPRIVRTNLPKPYEEDYVCIAVHATAQAKYWNSPSGWSDVIDFILSKGLKVILLSREGYEYMGNCVSKSAISFPNGPLESVVNCLRYAKLFIGVASGLSWLAWALGRRTCLISGFSFPYTEMQDCLRIFPTKSVCVGCFNRHKFDPQDWNWCPDHKNEIRMFECTRAINADQVIKVIQPYL